MTSLWKHVLHTTALFATVVVLALPTIAAQAQSDQRCFSETGFCIAGRIRDFWEKNGGLPVFGFPIGPQQEEAIEGKPLQVQRFERNRLELHPENQRPYDVLLGRLGVDRLAQQGRDWQAEFAPTSAAPGCRFFAETNHNVCGDILAAWRASGLEIDGKAGKTEGENLALFGLPLSDLRTETMADGQQRQIQWFERARFELHPENQRPYNVLLGLLGNELRGGGGTAQKPADQCADVKEPQNGRIRPAKCVTAGTQLSVDAYGFQPGEQIGFWLNAPDDQMIGTRQSLPINATGAVTGLPLDTTGLPAGFYSMVFQSVNTGYQAIIYFKILATTAAPPTAPIAPPAASPLPPSQNAVASPTSGPRGTRFSFVGSGFTPGENIGVYITAPDLSVVGAPFQVVADGQGQSEAVTLTTTSNFPVGTYAITFEGTQSKNKAIAYFAVTQ